MPVMDFTLLLNRVPTDEEEDLLYEAGCDDAVIERDAAGARMHFRRDADTLLHAAWSATRQVRTVPGLWAVHVALDEMVTLREIAARLGRGYEGLRLLATGKRGPGGFPAPAFVSPGGVQLWRWPEVARWLHESLGQDVEAPPRDLLNVEAFLGIEAAFRAARDEQERDELRQMLREAG